MEQVNRIIVLDDEAELRNMLQRFLTGHGFHVRAVADGKQLNRYLQREPYDLLVLDLMMEPEDGLSVCRRLRAEGQTMPILMLTAKGDPADRVIGLDTGADDYLAKPFLPDELVARIRALLRRQKIAAGDPTVASQMLSFGEFRFDVGKQTLTRAGCRWKCTLPRCCCSRRWARRQTGRSVARTCWPARADAIMMRSIAASTCRF